MLLVPSPEPMGRETRSRNSRPPPRRRSVSASGSSLPAMPASCSAQRRDGVRRARALCGGEFLARREFRRSAGLFRDAADQGRVEPAQVRRNRVDAVQLERCVEDRTAPVDAEGRGVRPAAAEIDARGSGDHHLVIAPAPDTPSPAAGRAPSRTAKATQSKARRWASLPPHHIPRARGASTPACIARRRR